MDINIDDQEREIIKEFEPQLYSVTDKIFGKTYDYTRRYRDFVKRNEYRR